MRGYSPRSNNTRTNSSHINSPRSNNTRTNSPRLNNLLTNNPTTIYGALLAESNLISRAVKLILFLAALTFLAGCSQAEVPVYQRNEEVILLTVLAGQSTSDAGIEDMIDEVLAEEFPNVKLQWECVDWGEKFNSQMQGRFAAGDIPDIMIGKAQDVQAYAHTGNLAVLQGDYKDKIREWDMKTPSALSAASP